MHDPSLLERKMQILHRSGTKLRNRIGENQYRQDEEAGRRGGHPIHGQLEGDEDVFRVDRRFRAHSPEHEVKVYGRARSSIERVNSRLEELVCLNRHRLRGLRDIAVHTALCVITMLLVGGGRAATGCAGEGEVCSFLWEVVSSYKKNI